MKKLIEKYGKNKVYICLVIALVVACAAGVGGAAVYANSKKQAILDSIYIKFIENPIIEYGSETIDYQSFIESSAGDVTLPATEAVDTKILGSKEVTYKVSKEGYEKEQRLTVEIKDTKAPEIAFKEETVTIEVGSEFNPKNNVASVADPIDGAIEIYEVAHNVDVNVPGEYPVTVKATDKNGNVAEKTYKVVVKEKEVKPQQPTNSTTSSTYRVPQQNSVSSSSNGNNGGGSNSSSNNSSNGLGYYPNLIGNSGRVFTSKAEASAWASVELDRYIIEGRYSGYDLMPIGIEGRDYDFWTVYFY